MNFLITDYVYPIEMPLSICEKHRFCLDNPRTDSEIDFVKNRIKYSHIYNHDIKLPLRADKETVSVASLLRDIRKSFKNDTYLNNFYNQHFRPNSHDLIYEFLARMWIISRFDDAGESERLEKSRIKMVEEGKHGFFLLNDDHPLIKNSSILSDYSNLISLLINTDGEEYFGGSFLSKNSSIDENIKHVESLLSLRMSGQKKANPDWYKNWLIFPNIKSQIVEVVTHLDLFIKNKGDKKLLYISNLLRIVSKQDNDKTKIVLLTSVNEFILTRNPDFSRFNVEDSINKQFQLKSTILIYQNNNARELQQVKESLKEIYNLRSCIAHGDFEKLDNIIAKKKNYYLSDTVTLLYFYIKAIIEEYIKDPNFVEFLKKS